MITSTFLLKTCAKNIKSIYLYETLCLSYVAYVLKPKREIFSCEILCLSYETYV